MSTQETEIATTPPEVVQYKNLTGDIERAEKMEAQVKFDYADKKGNAEARSHIHGLRKIKGSIERSRKDAKAGLLEMGKQIDSQAKAMESRVQVLIDRHEVPLLAIEAKEAERIAALQLRVDAIAAYGVNRAGEILSGAVTAARLRKGADQLAQIVVDDSFGEMQEAAQIAKANAAAYLEQAIQQAQAEEDKRAAAKAQADELARLRKEAEEAKRQREIEDARREAEHQAKAEAAAALREAEYEKLRLEREAIQHEADAKMAAERAELRRLQEERAAQQRAEEAKAKAEADKKAAVARAKAEAEAKARRIEEERLAKVEAERVAEEARKADDANRERIIKEIAVAIGDNLNGSDLELFIEIARAIVAGNIPHVKVEF